MVMMQPHLRVEISCLELCFSKCGPWTSSLSIIWEHVKNIQIFRLHPWTTETEKLRDETQQSVNCFSRWFWRLLWFEMPAHSLDHLLHGGRNFSDFSFFNPQPGDLHKCSLNDTELTGVEIDEGEIGNYREEEEGWVLGLRWVLCWDCWQPGYKNRSLGNLNKGHFERKKKIKNKIKKIFLYYTILALTKHHGMEQTDREIILIKGYYCKHWLAVLGMQPLLQIGKGVH